MRCGRPHTVNQSGVRHKFRPATASRRRSLRCVAGGLGPLSNPAKRKSRRRRHAAFHSDLPPIVFSNRFARSAAGSARGGNHRTGLPRPQGAPIRLGFQPPPRKSHLRPSESDYIVASCALEGTCDGTSPLPDPLARSPCPTPPCPTSTTTCIATIRITLQYGTTPPRTFPSSASTQTSTSSR